MVSINVFSTRLNTNIPITKVIKITTVEYNRLIAEKSPTPKNPYLNASNKDVNGLAVIKTRYFSGILDAGKITGVAYINSDTPKVNNCTISRYFTVKLENIIPKPKENKANSNIINGDINAQKVG